MNDARHASAPVGYKCADCTMDGDVCPVCYRTWWQQRHPNTSIICADDTELATLRAQLAQVTADKEDMVQITVLQAALEKLEEVQRQLTEAQARVKELEAAPQREGT
jgi:hypothetical protein